MRTTTATMLGFLLVLSAGDAYALAASPPAGDADKAAQETPAPGALKIRLVPETAADTADAADADEEAFVPPDGWLPKKHGKYTVYCRKDYNVRGTRIPAETCYDQKGIREMLMQERTDRERYDQMRRVCGNDATCGTH